MKQVAAKKVAMKKVATQKVAVKQVAMKRVAGQALDAREKARQKKTKRYWVHKAKRLAFTDPKGEMMTRGGLVRDQLRRGHNSRVVSVSRSDQAKKSLWAQALNKARKKLGITGFVLVGGKSPQGQQYLEEIRKCRDELKANMDC